MFDEVFESSLGRVSYICKPFTHTQSTDFFIFIQIAGFRALVDHTIVKVLFGSGLPLEALTLCR